MDPVDGCVTDRERGGGRRGPETAAATHQSPTGPGPGGDTVAGGAAGPRHVVETSSPSSPGPSAPPWGGREDATTAPRRRSACSQAFEAAREDGAPCRGAAAGGRKTGADGAFLRPAPGSFGARKCVAETSV